MKFGVGFGLTTLNNKLCVVGGDDNNNSALNTAERYDPDTNSCTPIASMYGHRAFIPQPHRPLTNSTHSE